MTKYGRRACGDAPAAYCRAFIRPDENRGLISFRGRGHRIGPAGAKVASLRWWMARISVTRTMGSYRITFAGRLSGRDLKRLERACGDALEHKRVPLELNLAKVTSIDDAARAYIERLRVRGAQICADTAPPRVDDCR
jgi:hypothetical protein